LFCSNIEYLVHYVFVIGHFAVFGLWDGDAIKGSLTSEYGLLYIERTTLEYSLQHTVYYIIKRG